LRAGWSEKAIGEEMNIASAREIEIVELAETINRLTGNKAGLTYTDRRKWDTKSRLLASIDKAKDLLGYDPLTTFENGLEQTIQWFRDNWNSINRDAEFPPGMSSAVKNYVLQQEEEQA
jgi:nucleoside-diphosphate-sugar epimerase